jgi:hypothetical protein
MIIAMITRRNRNGGQTDKQRRIYNFRKQ